MNSIGADAQAATIPALNPDVASTLRAPEGRSRVEPVDVLRGVAMILMALDHTRDFLGATNVSPTDLARTTALLFFTRWITHLCAPVFFLLTGTSAYLSLRRKSTRQLSGFLLTRGLWLLFLELTLFRCLAMQFNFDYHVTVLNVLWALGWAMITLAALVHLPVPAIAAFGVFTIVGHNALDLIQSPNPFWVLLHAQGFVVQTPHYSVVAAYPVLPWVGVTAVGYALGAIYDWTPKRRRRFLLSTGIALAAAFVVLRLVNFYGDPVRWTVRKTALLTGLSFLNTTKYPPSLLFLLMMLGPALVLLWVFDAGTPRLLRPAAVFGKVPMFYFLLHMPLIHLIAVVVCYVRYADVHWMFESPSIGQFPFTSPPGWGLSLPFVYLIWACVVVLLYPLCRRFGETKRRRGGLLLSYV